MARRDGSIGTARMKLGIIEVPWWMWTTNGNRRGWYHSKLYHQRIGDSNPATKRTSNETQVMPKQTELLHDKQIPLKSTIRI